METGKGVKRRRGVSVGSEMVVGVNCLSVVLNAEVVSTGGLVRDRRRGECLGWGGGKCRSSATNGVGGVRARRNREA
jgi:hypothetical protein